MPEEMDAETIAFGHRMFDPAQSGATDELTGFLTEGPANLTNDKGDTLLILAACHNYPQTVAMLLDRGADPGRVGDHGQTALATLVFRQNSDSVTTLLKAGADPAGGSPPATETAAFFDLPGMALLRGERQHDAGE